MKLKRIHLSRRTKQVLIVIGVLGVLRVLTFSPDEKSSPPKTQVEQVQVIDWRSVDESVRRAFKTSHEKACTYAESAVRGWMNELRQRSEDDFLPWYFAYWNQQALMLRNVGYMIVDTPLVEGIMGKQPSVETQLGDYLQDAFTARVLQPGTAQLKVEAITRKAVEVYLNSLNEELKAVQVEYTVTDQDWDRHLVGLSEMLHSVEGNRQVPLVLKGLTVGSGMATVKIVRSVTEQVKLMMMRRGSRELMEDSMYYGGRTVSRGLGWVWAVGFGVWDLYDHHRLVTQNKPVMRRLLNGYFDELENQILNDPQCGIFQTLETVRQELAGRLKEGQ